MCRRRCPRWCFATRVAVAAAVQSAVEYVRLRSLSCNVGRGADGMFLLESSRSDPRWTLLFPGARAFWG